MRSPYARALEESSHGIDLAPMLDFVVNLLIFFIVVAVFVKESAVSMQRPTDADPIKPSPTTTIEIGSDAEIIMDGRVVDLRSVRANVDHSVANDRKAVSIVARENAPTGVVIAVVDQVHLGGVHDITFSTAQ